MGSRLPTTIRVLRVLAIAALVLVVAGQGPALGGEPAPGLLPPGDWTEAQEAELLDLIERTEAAMDQFSDVETVRDMGFEDFGATAPGGYDHFTKQAWVDDDRFIDPQHPESLVFQNTWDPETGEMSQKLVSAMYMLPNDYGMEDIPDDIAWLPGWHVHESVCVNQAGTFAGLAAGDGTCSQGSPLLKPPMMHVWIVDEPCDHRFGGIGISGAHCDVTGHHAGGDDSEAGPTDTAPPADPANPVEGQATFTG